MLVSVRGSRSAATTSSSSSSSGVPTSEEPMPLRSSHSASASDTCQPVPRGVVGERDVERPGAGLGDGEDERVRDDRRGRSRRAAGCPTRGGHGRATRDRRAARSLSSAGPLTISFHAGHPLEHDRPLEPEERLERLEHDVRPEVAAVGVAPGGAGPTSASRRWRSSTSVGMPGHCPRTPPSRHRRANRSPSVR